MRLSAPTRSMPFSAVAVIAFLLLTALIGGASALGQAPGAAAAARAGDGVSLTGLVSSSGPQGHGDRCDSTCLPACAGIGDGCVGTVVAALPTAAAEQGPAMPSALVGSAPPRPGLPPQRERPAPSLLLLSINRT